MDISNFPAVESLAAVLGTIAKGPKALAEWLGKRTEQRYEEFIAAAREGQVFEESAEAMTADDLFAILRSLELDIEAEKATLYGRLASSIAKGKVRRDHKRHFIKALRELSHAQVQRLRRAWIASKYELRPSRGIGRREAKEFLVGGGIGAIDETTLRHLALVDGENLTAAGAHFVEACFLGEELKPASIGQRQWAKGVIQIICNEMNEATCRDFIARLSADGQANAIKVTNTAAIRGRSEKFRIVSGSLIVLFVRDPENLVQEWEVVERMTRNDVTFVTASFNKEQPARLASLIQCEHFDASQAGGAVASQAIIALFERLGYGGDIDR